MASKRLRGVSAFLQDVTNTEQQQIPRSKRTCSDRAVAMVKQHSYKTKCAPRGRHAIVEEVSEDHLTLKKVIDSRHDVIEQGVKRIQEYTERNTTFVMQKAFTIQLFGCLVLQGVGIIAASQYAAACSSFCARTIRIWASNIFVDYFSTATNLDDITDNRLELEIESSRGKHPKWFSLLADENFKKQLKKYVLDNGYVKGRPNLTLQMIVDWVKESEGIEICKSTASLWLHDLGFTYQQFSKGVYFDGHERDDVVESRKVYLDTLDSLRHRMWVSHSPRPDPLIRPVIRIFHDESTYYANADQSYHWTDGTIQALKQKSLGQSVMVSDFIEEVDGFLKYESEEARLLLEHQAEGYFNNDMLVEQVGRAIDIFEKKYPGVQAVFIFDHAPSHMKRPDDALNAEKMNVKDGGKQPFMRDTIWRGSVQRMVTDEGIQKGMRSVLEERGVNTKGLNAEGLRNILLTHEDFKTQKTILENIIESRDHICLYLPKFHCELNPIERCWCQSKKHTRAHCNGSIVRLRKIIPESLNSISLDMIARFFAKSNDYESAYRDGHTANTADKAVKQYKSHRRVVQ